MITILKALWGFAKNHPDWAGLLIIILIALLWFLFASIKTVLFFAALAISGYGIMTFLSWLRKS